VVSQVNRTDGVPLHGAETPVEADQRQVVADREGTAIEQDVVVGAEAQHVPRYVRPVVRRAQRLDVCPLRVGAGRWDADAVYKPYAIFDGKRWLLWYNGRRGGVEQIGTAIHDGEDLGF